MGRVLPAGDPVPESRASALLRRVSSCAVAASRTNSWGSRSRTPWRAIANAILLGSWVVAPSGPLRSAESKPNILFILADDLGWRDVGCYGSTRHKTPHIDGLARRGLRFTQASSASPLCSPTRASILTGLFPARIGITVPVCHLPQEVLDSSVATEGRPDKKSLEVQSATRLRQEYFTLAESLKAAGYVTGHFGKWHLGPEPFDPLHQGFDVDLPHAPVPGPYPSYLAPWKFWPGEGTPGDHIEDRMALEAARFIREQKGHPFFLNYWAFSVHAPFDGKREYIDQHRAESLEPGELQRCPEYAAMVHSLDDAVGVLVRALEEEGLLRNTIVIFTSDNGGNMYNDVDGVPPTNNHPLRSGKASYYEGGTRVPCIILWPGLTEPGTATEVPIMSTDFFPTFCEVLGIPCPPGVPFDGSSFAPLLRGDGFDRGPLFCHFPHPMGKISPHPASWARQGDWKLIRLYYANDDQTDRFELYNLREDIGEARDLSADQPERVVALSALLGRFLSDTGAKIPAANPSFDPTLIPSVGGWRAAHDAAWKRGPDGFVLRCAANDPQIVAELQPARPGPFRVEFRMRSSGKGPAMLYWSGGQPFARQRSVTVPLRHDGRWNNYSAEVPAKGQVKSLRLDPCSAAGEIGIDFVRLSDAQGKEVATWRFDVAK